MGWGLFRRLSDLTSCKSDQGSVISILHLRKTETQDHTANQDPSSGLSDREVTPGIDLPADQTPKPMLAAQTLSRSETRHGASVFVTEVSPRARRRGARL